MTGKERRFLVFRIEETRYALALQDVAEILEPLPGFPIPRAPAFLRGVVNAHGTLVPVLDLALFLGQDQTRPCGELLVIGGADVALALSVDRVETIVAESAILGEDQVDGDTLATATLHLDGGEARLLAIDRLVQAIEESMSR